MKNLRITSCIIVIALFLGSCSQKPSEMIIGEWKITDVKTTAEIPDEQLDAYNEYIENIKATTSLTLNADNTYIRIEDGEETKGNWRLSDDVKKFTLVYEGTEEVSMIAELTENKLSVTLDVNDEKNTIVYEKVAAK